jgi:hypothetical protein
MPLLTAERDCQNPAAAAANCDSTPLFQVYFE